MSLLELTLYHATPYVSCILNTSPVLACLPEVHTSNKTNMKRGVGTMAQVITCLEVGRKGRKFRNKERRKMMHGDKVKALSYSQRCLAQMLVRCKMTTTKVQIIMIRMQAIIMSIIQMT